MKIIVGDVYSELSTTDMRVRSLVDSVCRARPAGYQFMKKYKSRQWDGYISLRQRNRIPTGLLGLVVPVLRERRYTVELVWDRVTKIPPATLSADWLQGITLRDNQLDAANTLLTTGRGIAKMATNAGKTEVIAAMLKHYGRGLLVVSSVDLLWQAHDRLSKRIGVQIGMVGDGIKDFQGITVATIQTLAAMNAVELAGRNFRGNVSIFIDECHHGSSATHMAVLDNVPGFHRFGFSGTPLKNDLLDDLKLIGATGKVLVDVTNQELIDAGYSAKPVVTMHVVPKGDDVNDYHEERDIYIVNNDVRNSMVCNIATAADGVVLVVVDRVVHGRLLQRMIPGSVFVYGGDKSDRRRQVLELMRTTPGVYIATNIFDEGVDVPAINTIVMAAGGKSPRILLQRIGRGLRAKPDGGMLHVHDFIDDSEHLLEHSDARLEVYLQEGFDVTTV